MPAVETSEPTAKARVNALASSNAEPLIPELLSRGIKFGAAYNLEEQRRVYRALCWLAENPNDELWEALLLHFNDRRYSLTRTGMGKQIVIGNDCVGNFCNLIAFHRLEIPLARASRAIDGAGKVPSARDVAVDLLGWRERHAGMTLRQLQIEVCKGALKKIDESSEWNAESRALAKDAIEHEIVELERSNKAMFEPFPLNRLHFYLFDFRRHRGAGADNE